MTPEETKKLFDDLNELAVKLRAELKKLDALGADPLKKTNETIEAIQTKIDAIEVKLARPALSDRRTDRDPAEASAHHKSLMRWARFGPEVLTQEDRQSLAKVAIAPGAQKALTLSDATTGGFLASPEITGEIIKGLVEFTPVREIARVRQTSKHSVISRKRTGTFAAVRVGEVGTKTETTGLTYGREEIGVHEIYAMVDISQADLEDSDFNLEAELSMEAAEQFGVKEGAEFVTGTGVGMLEGVVTNSAVTIKNSGDASALRADGLIDLLTQPKSGYLDRSVFLARRSTIGAIRKLKDGNGQYLWQVGIQAGMPSILLGQPLREAPDVAAVAANAKAVLFGDFKRGYDYVERTNIEMLRDPFTQAATGKVRFIFRRRSGGQVVVAEALAIQKIAA